MQNLLRTDEWWMRQRRENTVLVQSCGCRHGREHDPLWWRMEAKHVGTCSRWYLAPHGWIIGLPRSAKKLLPPWQQTDGTSRWGYFHTRQQQTGLLSFFMLYITVTCRYFGRLKKQHAWPESDWVFCFTISSFPLFFPPPLCLYFCISSFCRDIPVSFLAAYSLRGTKEMKERISASRRHCGQAWWWNKERILPKAS